MVTNAQLIKVLIHLASSHREQFEQRRRYEWRIIFTALSFYVATAAAFLGGDLDLQGWRFLIVGVAYLLLAIFTCIYLAFIHMAHNMNKSIAEYAEDTLMELALGGQPQGVKKINDIIQTSRHWVSWRKLFIGAGVWSWAWQSVILLAVALAAWFLLWA